MEKLVEVDARALLKLTEELAEIPQVIPQAVASAINKTMSSTVTQIKREVASEYTVKQKDVSKAIKQTKARSSRLKAAAVAGGGQISLFKFKHTPPLPPPRQKYKNPVKVAVKKGGGAKVVRRFGNPAFINNLKWKANDGSEGVSTAILVRLRKKKAYPIKKLYSTSIAQMISDANDSKGSIKRIKARTEEMLTKRVDEEINYRLDKAKQKAGKGGSK